MDLELEQQTHDIEETHWWYRERRRMIAGFLAGAPLAEPCRILDAGCGKGRNLEMLAPFGTVTGVEPAALSVAAARARGVGTGGAGLARLATAARVRRLDLVVCLDVLEHVDDDLAAIATCDASRPRRRLLVTLPAHPWPWGTPRRGLRDVRRSPAPRCSPSPPRPAGSRYGSPGSTPAFWAPIALARASDRVLWQRRQRAVGSGAHAKMAQWVAGIRARSGGAAHRLRSLAPASASRSSCYSRRAET